MSMENVLWTCALLNRRNETIATQQSTEKTDSLHTILTVCHNRSAVQESNGLGVLQHFSIVKPGTYNSGIQGTYACLWKQERLNHMDLFLQENGDLHMCSSQTEQNIAQILLFLDDLLMFHQTFCVSYNRCGMFVAGGACTSIRNCACM